MTQKGVAAMKIRPALDEVKTIAAAGGYKVLPVSGEILSDICTPIEALKILKNVSTHCYLLESAQPSEKWGRYTFLGLDPKMEITRRNGVMKAGELTFETQDPSQTLRQILAQYKSPRFAPGTHHPFAGARQTGGCRHHAGGRPHAGQRDSHAGRLPWASGHLRSLWCYGHLRITRAILAGEKGPKRDAVLLNAGASLYIGGKAETMADGIALAAQLIDSGKAAAVLEKFIAVSNRPEETS